MRRNSLGIIGGSVLDDAELFKGAKDIRVDTPYGQVLLVRARVAGQSVLLASRHGPGHTIPPAEVNYRGIAAAMKMEGATHVVGISAVGSFKRDLRPGDLVIPDQFIDRTHGRPDSFFGIGCVGHIGLADPVCPRLARALHRASAAAGHTACMGGTLAVIQGPRFGTRREGEALKAMGASIVGMTTMPEAALHREAEICFASLSIATDYDAGMGEVPPVSHRMVSEALKKNGSVVRAVIRSLVGNLPDRRCGCKRALDHAVATSPGSISKDYLTNPVFVDFFRRKGYCR